MKENQSVSVDYFIKRLIKLCLRSGLSGFPKNDVDQHILLKSVVLTIGLSNTFSEKEIDEKLKYWIKHIGKIKNLDHTTLRRRLIDTGYLTRKSDGSSYQVNLSEPQGVRFEASVNGINIQDIITTAQEEIARRKKMYIGK